MLKKCRLLILLALAFALCVGTADAFSPAPHEWRRYEGASARGVDDRARYVPRAEAVVAAGDKIYGLYTLSAGSFPDFSYKPSVIVEFDADMTALRHVALNVEDGPAGKNAERMAYHDGKLYVACLGGAQVTGTWGDVWAVDVTDMTASQVLDAKDLAEFSSSPDALVTGISIAKDGAAFVLVLAYEEDYSVTPKLYVTDVTKLSKGDAGKAIDLTGAGYAWDIVYSEEAETLWCTFGSELQARDKSGALVKTFTAQELGNNAAFAAPLADTGAGKPGAFYTASAADYTSGSTGVITKDGAAFTVSDQVANYGSDLRAYTYADPDGNERVLLRDTLFVASDALYVWDASDWATPVLNASGQAANIHGVSALGQYLYLAAYDTLKTDGTLDSKGEFVRLDMKDGYKRDKVHELEYVVDGLAKGEAAMASPDLPTGAPAGVEAVMPALAASADFIASTDFTAADIDVASDGRVTLKTDAAKKFAGTLLPNSGWDGNEIAEVIPLPAFKAAVSKSGGLAALGFTVTGETLMMGEPQYVKVMKARGESRAPLAFSYVKDAAEYADGTFTVLEGSAPTTAILSLNEYTLVLFIKDGGEYDLDAADAAILDPAVIVRTSTGGGSSGGGGGCDMGGAAAIALFVAAVFFRRARRCDEKK